MQRLRITIGKHIQLQGHQPAGVLLDQSGRESTAGLLLREIRLVIEIAHLNDQETSTLNTTERLRS